MEDGRCKLGLAERLELVRLIDAGATLRAAAAAMNVAPATAHRWWHRWHDATETERASRACLRARPPVPRSCPWRLDETTEGRILLARERTNLGPARLAGVVGYRRSTIWKVLHRHGCSQRRRTPKEPFTRRYEWSEPGALLHMDAKQLPRFDQPGHGRTVIAAVSSRTPAKLESSSRMSWSTTHTRLAYVEVHPHHRGEIAAAVLARAAAWLREQGCGPVEAVMTDNAFAYINSNAFAQTLTDLSARHIRIPPRTPRWNRKAERFIRTLDEEWAHGRVWLSSTRRDRPLSSFLRYQQPAKAAHLTQRPATHQPRSPRPRATQLVADGAIAGVEGVAPFVSERHSAGTGARLLLLPKDDHLDPNSDAPDRDTNGAASASADGVGQPVSGDAFCRGKWSPPDG
jgi:transposase-like protein